MQINKFFCSLFIERKTKSQNNFFLIFRLNKENYFYKPKSNCVNYIAKLNKKKKIIINNFTINKIKSLKKFEANI